MAQLMLENTDAETKLKKAQLDKEAELRRRSQDDADRCSTLQHSRTAALATCNAQRLQRSQCRRRNIQPTRRTTCAHVACDGRRHGRGLSPALWCLGSPLATSAPGLGSPLAHLRRDRGRPPTSALSAVTSAPGPGPPLIGTARVRGALPSQVEGGARQGARRVRRRSSSRTVVCFTALRHARRRAGDGGRRGMRAHTCVWAWACAGGRAFIGECTASCVRLCVSAASASACEC